MEAVTKDHNKKQIKKKMNPRKKKTNMQCQIRNIECPLARKCLTEAIECKSEIDGINTSDQLGARLNSAGMAIREPSQTTMQVRQHCRLTSATTALTTKKSNGVSTKGPTLDPDERKFVMCA